MQRYDWKLNGNLWLVNGANGVSYQMRNTNGVFYLKELVTNPNCAIHYPLLISRGYDDNMLCKLNSDSYADLIKQGLYSDTITSEFPKADQKTLYEVGKEILRVEDKITRLTHNHDLGAVEALHEELEKLYDYQHSIAYSNNKLKVFYSEQTKLRNCVKQSLRRLYVKIRPFDPAFAAKMMKSIHMYEDRIIMERMSEIRFIE